MLFNGKILHRIEDDLPALRAFAKIVARTLDRPQEREDDGRVYAMPAGTIVLSQSRMADLLGLTREAARAILARLERLGLLEITTVWPLGSTPGTTNRQSARTQLKPATTRLFAARATRGPSAERPEATNQSVASNQPDPVTTRVSEAPATSDPAESNQPKTPTLPKKNPKENIYTSHARTREAEPEPPPTPVPRSVAAVVAPDWHAPPDIVQMFRAKYPGLNFAAFERRFVTQCISKNIPYAEPGLALLAWADRESNPGRFRNDEHHSASPRRAAAATAAVVIPADEGPGPGPDGVVERPATSPAGAAKARLRFVQMC